MAAALQGAAGGVDGQLLGSTGAVQRLHSQGAGGAVDLRRRVGPDDKSIAGVGRRRGDFYLRSTVHLLIRQHIGKRVNKQKGQPVAVVQKQRRVGGAGHRGKGITGIAGQNLIPLLPTGKTAAAIGQSQQRAVLAPIYINPAAGGHVRIVKQQRAHIRAGGSNTKAVVIYKIRPGGSAAPAAPQQVITAGSRRSRHPLQQHRIVVRQIKIRRGSVAHIVHLHRVLTASTASGQIHDHIGAAYQQATHRILILPFQVGTGAIHNQQLHCIQHRLLAVSGKFRLI